MWNHEANLNLHPVYCMLSHPPPLLSFTISKWVIVLYLVPRNLTQFQMRNLLSWVVNTVSQGHSDGSDRARSGYNSTVFSDSPMPLSTQTCSFFWCWLLSPQNGNTNSVAFPILLHYFWCPCLSHFTSKEYQGGGGRRAYLLNIYYVPGALVPHGIFVPHGILFSSRPD